MKRLIVDYKKLNEKILNLLVEKFPDGYSDTDIITFRNQNNEVIDAVEIKIEDTIYLVKIGKRLIQAMEDFGEDETLDEEPTEVDFETIEEESEED